MRSMKSMKSTTSMGSLNVDFRKIHLRILYFGGDLGVKITPRFGLADAAWAKIMSG